MERIGLVFGYGQKADGQIDGQTIDRCNKAVAMYRMGKITQVFLTVSAEKNGISMAESMQTYLINQGVREVDIIVDRRGGNTAGEMDIFLYLVPRRTKVMFISSWYHLPRITWLALWRISPTRFSLGVAWRHVHLRADVLVEFAKLANAVLKPLRSSKILFCAPAIN